MLYLYLYLYHKREMKISHATAVLLLLVYDRNFCHDSRFTIYPRIWEPATVLVSHQNTSQTDALRSLGTSCTGQPLKGRDGFLAEGNQRQNAIPLPHGKGKSGPRQHCCSTYPLTHQLLPTPACVSAVTAIPHVEPVAY